MVCIYVLAKFEDEFRSVEQEPLFSLLGNTAKKKKKKKKKPPKI